MVRKMAFVGISYIAGLFFASFFSIVINLIAVFGIAAVLLAYAFCFKNRKKEVFVIAISFCAAIIVNVAYTKLFYENIIRYDNQNITFEGVITDVSELQNDKAIYKVKGKINGVDNAEILVFSDNISCEYFDKISFSGNLSRLEDTLSFPSESYYKPKNIFLEVQDVTSMKITPNENPPIKKYILNYRDYIYNRITQILPNEEGAFLGALLCGEKTKLNSNVSTTLFRSGIGHIISVSGAHLMIIAALVLWVLKKFRLRRWNCFLITEVVIIAFSVFSGLAISVIRAGIMFTVLMLGTITKRRADTLNSIGIAGFLLTIATPFAARDASLLLSLAGVFGLAVFAPFVVRTLAFKGRLANAQNALITMVCVSVATFPFVVLYFDEVSIISPITNILLAPLCSVALVCGLIVAAFGGISIIAYPLLLVGGLCLKAVLLISALLVKLPFAYLPLGYSFIPLTLALCLVGIAAITLYFKTKKALISSILSSVIILLSSALIFQTTSSGELRTVVLSKGNSTAVLIHDGKTASVIDLEGKGEISEIVEKYLNKKGIKEISVLVLNENSLKTIASYEDSITSKIEYITKSDSGAIFLPDRNVSEFSVGSSVKISDFEIIRLSENSYNIKYGKFSLICDGKNDTISNGYVNSQVKLVIEKNSRQIQTQNHIIKLDDNSNGEAFLIASRKNGDYSIRRLSNALRE